MFVLDAYAARSCPVKTHNAFHPGVQLPAADESLREGFHGGTAFKADVLARILADAPGTVVDCRPLLGGPSGAQEEAWREAVAAGADLIVCGLLPRDWVGHRSGRPDLLVKAPDGGYQPVHVKFHRVLDTRANAELHVSRLADPAARERLAGQRFRWSWRLNDVLQLAHYRRMLEGLGVASADPWAAIIGTDEVDGGWVLSWVRLDQPLLSPNPRMVSDAQETPLISALERYDHEFGFREQLAETAAACAPDDPPVLRPIVNRECAYCQWWDSCRPQLHEDDLSLRINKSPLDAHEIAVLRELGVETVAELATAEIEQLLTDYLPRVTHRGGAEDRLRLAWRRSVLMARGIDFDRVTTGPILLPDAPLELDIDVETSMDDRVYLWGFLISGGPGALPDYRSFAAFRDLDDQAEWALARDAMAWLREQVAAAPALVFHYSDYEIVRLNRLAAASGDPTIQWGADYAREHFVDLFAPIREHFFGTQGLGLKVVANRAAGFSWRDEAPGGLNSQAWFTEAVHGDTADARARAQQRVLEYNEDDVRATWHVRRWLRGLGE